MHIFFKKIDPRATIPAYLSQGASGFGLRCLTDIKIHPKEWVLVKTGLVAQIPRGYEIQIRSLDGLAMNTFYTIKGGVQTYSQDSRDGIGVIVLNVSEIKCVDFKAGDLVAQGVIAPVVRGDIMEVHELDGVLEAEMVSTGNYEIKYKDGQKVLEEVI